MTLTPEEQAELERLQAMLAEAVKERAEKPKRATPARRKKRRAVRDARRRNRSR